MPSMALHARPIMDLATGETVRHELLVRVARSDEPLVPPIADVDRWVIRQGLRLAGRGHAIELNLSARSLAERGLVEDLENGVRRSAADPRLVCFQMTAAAVLRDAAAAQAFVARSRTLGCQLALGRLGTGDGGLACLRRVPVHFLKIDAEFVRDLPRDPAGRHAVRAVVSLAQRFGLKTVAEGVGDEETLHTVADHGVDYAQGDHVGRPTPLPQTPAARLR
jgi:EAL domain-containing protein (putative c-di-GMP-specific phosphodiesterase class I)